MASLIATDPFLLQHCTPVLFEKEPPPSHPASRPYLDSLRDCAVYVLLIANEYGQRDGDFSAMHYEYRLAQDLQLPTIIFIKGATDAGRSEETNELIKEIKRAGHTYKRFHDRRSSPLPWPSSAGADTVPVRVIHSLPRHSPLSTRWSSAAAALHACATPCLTTGSTRQRLTSRMVSLSSRFPARMAIMTG